MKTMKAAVINECGDFDVLKYSDIEIPKVEAGEVLIKVLAAGVNRFDHYLREGSVTKLSFPHILGADAAGIIEDTGEGVADFTVGDKVIPIPGYPLDQEDWEIKPMATAPSFTPLGMSIWGTYAQYLKIPSKWVVKDNTGLPPEEVAALPMVMMTTVRAVKVVGEVKKGDKVLIHAGASGTGSMAIQVAKALGAEVATTIRSEDKIKFVEGHGADKIINSKKENFVEVVKEWTGGAGADVVIDNLGGDVLPKSIDAVKALGIVVAYGFVAGTEVTFDIRNFFFGQKQIRGTMFGDVEDLEWGLEQVQKGTIKPLLDRTLPLSEAAQAHQLIASNQVAGNIVLLPWEE